jgi:hypothetical protein
LTKDQLVAKEKLEQNEKNVSELELRIAAYQEKLATQKGVVEDSRREIGSMLKDTIAELPKKKGE